MNVLPVYGLIIQNQFYTAYLPEMKESIFNKILRSENKAFSDLAILLLRLTIGILLFMAGSGKALGLFGGYGIQASLQGYGKMHFSHFLAYLSIYTEFIGGLMLAAGLITRPVSFAILINMAVATIVTLPNGIMGPMGAQTPLIFLVVDLAILLYGPGNYSFDSLLFRGRDK